MMITFLVDGTGQLWNDALANWNQPKKAARGFSNRLAEMVRRWKPDKLACCFDGSSPFRYELYPAHKEAWITSTAPSYAEASGIVKDWLWSAGIESLSVVGFEAEDVIASILPEDRVVIASGSRQVLQLIHPAGDVVILRKFNTGQDRKTRQPHWYQWSDLVWDVWEVGGKLAEFDYMDWKCLVGGGPMAHGGAEGIGEFRAKQMLVRYGDLEGIRTAMPEVHIGSRWATALDRERLDRFFCELPLIRSLMTLRRDVDVHPGDMPVPDLGKYLM